MDTGVAAGGFGLERQEIPEMIVRVACSEEQAQAIFNEYKADELPDSEGSPNAAYFFHLADDKMLALIRFGLTLDDIETLRQPTGILTEIAEAAVIAAPTFVNIRDKYSSDDVLKHVVYEMVTQYLLQQHRADTIGGIH